MIDRATLILGTGFGIGYLKPGPGTWGSLLGPPLAFGLQAVGVDGWLMLVAALVTFLIGVPICSRACLLIGSYDAGSVVYDEIVAFLVLFAFIQVTWATALAGFVLFRLFDITKPWPIRRIEKLPGGWGIMADDTAAAIVAGGILFGMLRLM